VIAKIGPAAARAIPVLLHALQTWPFGYWDIETALKGIGPDAVGYLRDLQYNEQTDNRLRLARILDGIDDPSGQSVEILCGLLQDADEYVAQRALTALRKLHPARVRRHIPEEAWGVEQFIPALFSPKRKTAERALRVLRTNDPDEWDAFIADMGAGE
jgi:hypothetical protein